MIFDFAVFIGRFQPFHLGHQIVIQQALALAKDVLVFVGGAYGARRPRNPWSFEERADMIMGAFSRADRARIAVIRLPDYIYNETAWIQHVQSEVAAQVNLKFFDPMATPKIALIGRRKDHSGYYLDLFPQWDSIAASAHTQIDATAIRKMLFEKQMIPGADLVPRNVSDFLTSYFGSPEGHRMRAEWDFIQDYKNAHDDGPYHRNNVTADAIVVQAAHVLVVRRKAHPGKGRLALPGGHVNKDELPLDAAVRELREETGIKVPEPVLRGSIEKHRVFDDPYRSDLARTYTFAYLFRLKGEGGKLAKLRAGSDAESAFWMPMNEIDEGEMFDDHYHIIQNLLGVG